MLLGVATEHYTRQPILLQYHIIIFKCDMCDKFSNYLFFLKCLLYICFTQFSLLPNSLAI